MIGDEVRRLRRFVSRSRIRAALWANSPITPLLSLVSCRMFAILYDILSFLAAYKLSENRLQAQDQRHFGLIVVEGANFSRAGVAPKPENSPHCRRNFISYRKTLALFALKSSAARKLQALTKPSYDPDS